MTYTIKDLEWEGRRTCGGPIYYVSADGLSHYEVSLIYRTAEYRQGRKDNGKASDWGFYEGRTLISEHPTLEAAKQAAQDHWEERLKGALVEVKV